MLKVMLFSLPIVQVVRESDWGAEDPLISLDDGSNNLNSGGAAGGGGGGASGGGGGGGGMNIPMGATGGYPNQGMPQQPFSYPYSSKVRYWILANDFTLLSKLEILLWGEFFL